MTLDQTRIAAIQARLDAWRENVAEEDGDSDLVAIFEAHSADDVAYLLAALARLQAENTELHGASEGWERSSQQWMKIAIEHNQRADAFAAKVATHSPPPPKLSWPICDVCKLLHRPARFAIGGPPRCWHCGQIARKCRCYPFLLQRLSIWLKGLFT